MNIKKRLINKAVVLTVMTSMYSTAAFASPIQDAQDFAAQFKKEPAAAASVNEVPDTFKTEITTINETPDKPVEVFGEGVDPNYKYVPEENDDVSIPPSAITNGPKFNFDFQGTPLTSALYAIGRLSHANILLVDKSDLNQAKVYATLKNVTAEEAISYLCGSYDLNYTFENGSFRISADEDTMLQTQRYNVRFADKEKLVNELKALGIDEKNVYANDEYSTVTVTANSYQLSQAEKLIASVDKPVAQAMIVAQLIETTHTKDLDAGLNYTMPTYTHDVDDPLSHQNWLTKMTFGVTSSLNESISKGKVLSRPIIITENGHEAELFMGDRVPIPQTTTSDGSTNITFDYQDVGNTLKIKPSIDKKSGIVSLDIDTEIKNITKYIEQGGMQAPQIGSREAKTIAHLKSGQTFVIGGLMSKEDLDTLSGIPILRKLPILGKLFEYHMKNKNNTEVFIAITPYILTDTVTSDDILKEIKAKDALNDTENTEKKAKKINGPDKKKGDSI